MERPGDLMTVKDFATAAGRSQQAIYKQIGTRLASYVHEKEGQKCIERRALVEVFKVGEIQPDSTERLSTDNNVEQPILAVLQTTIDALREQLATKDQQIAELTATVQAQAESLQVQAKSLQAAQALHAGTMQQMLPEAAPDGSVTVVAADPIQETPAEGKTGEPPRKWWQFWL